ncbi:MAG: F420-dependent NADP oxidoreductase [Anaerolineae bacterium]|nr:F420-dependent NADP oxidoreductase [Anaerolineae bacterium]NUQ05015.1 DUF2520 domain-containing protein [Anaerolineae bacterium]
MNRPTLGWVGAGRAASGMARALAARGWRIETVTSRDGDSARVLAESVGARATADPAAVGGDLVILAVPDGAIAEVAARLAEPPASWAGRAVVHTSGATEIAVLEPLAARSAQIGGLHPAYPFSSDRTLTPPLSGVTFAVEADSDPLRAWLTALVDSLDGKLLTLPPGARPVYHAALVFASNYTITLIGLAARLMERFGASPDAAKGALDSLVAGMVENVRREGAVAALPGPLARVDLGTLAAHMRALGQLDSDTARLYAELARATYPILRARGVSMDRLAAIERALGEE